MTETTAKRFYTKHGRGVIGVTMEFSVSEIHEMSNISKIAMNKASESIEKDQEVNPKEAKPMIKEFFPEIAILDIIATSLMNKINPEPIFRDLGY